MNKHVEKAMEIRNETPMVNNCAQTILRAYADELGITGDMAAKLSANFGGGMKCGSTCGAITGGLMVLGALGVENPYVINQFRRRIADNHNGMTDCADRSQGGGRNTCCELSFRGILRGRPVEIRL